MKYTYSIQNDFPNHKVNLGRLTNQIITSSITIAFDYINSSGDICDIYFKSTLSNDEKIILDGLVAAHSGEPLPSEPSVTPVKLVAPTGTDVPVTTLGQPLVAISKPDYTRYTCISHDFCNKQTWYYDAPQIVDEIAVDSGDHTIYTVSHSYIIDSYHGLLVDEDFLKDASGSNYRVIVKVNDVTKTEQDPHYGTGGDYTINYPSGSITFLSPLQESDVVKVTYHYASGSTYVIKPPAGKAIVFDSSEIQFTKNIVLTDSVRFSVWGKVDSFAPSYMNPPYNIPSGTLIKLGNDVVYKGMRDFINGAWKSFPEMPAMSEINWRGLTQPVVVMHWEYTSTITICSSKGMEIRVSLDHDTPLQGEYGTCTFWGSLKNSC